MRCKSNSNGEEEKPLAEEGIAKVLNILVQYFFSVSFPFFEANCNKMQNVHICDGQ